MNERKTVRCPQCGTIISYKEEILEYNPASRTNVQKKKRKALECPECGYIFY